MYHHTFCLLFVCLLGVENVERLGGGEGRTHSEGWRTKARTLFLWLVRTAFVLPAAKSQSRMVQSWLPVTTCGEEDKLIGRENLVSSPDPTLSRGEMVW